MSVAPGLAMGPVHRKDYDLSKVNVHRVPRDQVERELNRFHRSLTDSRNQLADLKQRLQGKVPEDHARILDTHVAYLKDSVFLSDVENLILNEQMSLEGAIAKVILDFDRIFRLVESEVLRERAVDLRDVGIRVLRNLERDETAGTPGVDAHGDYVLVARELSIVDMFNLDNEHVLGIVTEEGSLTSHAAILARSMRIPTLTGVEGLLRDVAEGDFVIVDSSEGVVRVRPDELVRAQYREARSEGSAEGSDDELPEWARRERRTADGEPVTVSATCGNLPEVERARALGMTGVGLYRTELLFLIDREPPSLESLVAHYRSVLEQARPGGVTFRLLDVDSSLELPYLHEEREPNPGLGRLGIRALFAHQAILRRQLQALLRAGAARSDAKPLRIAVPKLVDCGELRRLKEILFEERFALKKAGSAGAESVEVGVVVETPAAAVGIEDFVHEADFLVVGLDSLQQYLLAADRDNGDLASFFERVHPYVVRCLRAMVEIAEEADKPVSVFGFTAMRPENLPLLLGVGLRTFAVPPVALRDFVDALGAIRMRDAERAADVARRVSCPSELGPVLEGYGRGFGS